jgi:predicted nuclease of predicted toxin-antitoxin system
MRVLLDENLPRQLKQHFPADVEVLTVQERGWSGIKNSALLRLAAGEFEVFLTMDRGVEFQQNLQGLSIGVLIIRAPSNRFEDLQPLISEVHNTLSTIQPGQVLRVGS